MVNYENSPPSESLQCLPCWGCLCIWGREVGEQGGHQQGKPGDSLKEWTFCYLYAKAMLFTLRMDLDFLLDIPSSFTRTLHVLDIEPTLRTCIGSMRKE